jgi:Ca2+-binding RTX toxin-like protein
MATIPGGAYMTDTHSGEVLHGTGFGDDMFLHFGHDKVDAGDGNDLVYSTGGHTEVDGGAGNDIIFTYDGHNFVDGGAGSDIITVGGHNNLAEGGSGDDVIYGGQGGDNLLGGDGNDAIHAGSGKEFMAGGDGNDVLYAGHGDNTMVGGAGDNMFVFGSGGGKNVVVDFHDGDSLLIAKNINGLHVSTPQDILAHVADDNGNAVITLGHETITLLNIKAEDIHNNPAGYFHVH